MRKCRISVVGNNFHIFLNALTIRNIVIKNIEYKDDSMIFDTDFKNFDRLKKLFEHSNYQINIIKYPKYSTTKEFFYKNLGVLIALCLVFIALFTYSQSIWQCKIYGNEIVSEDDIISLLNQNGIKKGVSKSSIDIDSIQKLLQNNIEDIALTSVNVVGTTLVITISEKIDNTNILDNTQPIVSDYDCIITSIKTIAGTALVQNGDKVAKGETIIANYVIDNEGNQIPSKAVGEVYADIYYNYTKTYFANEIVLERSGKVYRYNDIEICGLKINGKNNSKFDKYEVETRSYYIQSAIPILVTEHTVYELVETNVENDLSNVENLLESTTNYAKKYYNVCNYDDIITNLSKTEDNVTISISFVVNKKIV